MMIMKELRNFIIVDNVNNNKLMPTSSSYKIVLNKMKIVNTRLHDLFINGNYGS